MKIIKCSFFTAILIILVSHQFVNAKEVIKNNVIAHRGAWKNFGLPENSLASLRKAIELKCAGSEFDVRITSDDSLVVVHDPTYHGLSIERNTYSELSKKKLSNGEVLPTLRSYLKEGLHDNRSTSLILEIKPSEFGSEKGKIIAEKVWNLVQEINAQEKIIFISFDFEILKKLKTLENSLSVHYLGGDLTPDEISKNGIDGINYHFSTFQKNPDLLKEAKANKLFISSWTVNNSNMMDLFLDDDFDFITTDEPEILLSKIEVREIKSRKKLVWFDEFDQDGLPNSDKWSFDTRGNDWSWGNNELQWYTDSNLKNAEISNGTLKITAHKEPIENKKYSAARLRSLGKGDFRYGYFEISAKLPTGNGTWPAIWMLPSNSEKRWPEGGEIDIMEHVGFNPDTVFATVHTKAHNHIINTEVGKDFLLPSAVSEFNVYSLYWDEEVIKAYVNGICYFTYEKNGQGTDVWPFDNEFHILLNLAIGGGLGGKKGIDDSLFPHVFEIDYVRVYQ